MPTRIMRASSLARAILSAAPSVVQRKPGLRASIRVPPPRSGGGSRRGPASRAGLTVARRERVAQMPPPYPPPLRGGGNGSLVTHWSAVSQSQEPCGQVDGGAGAEGGGVAGEPGGGGRAAEIAQLLQQRPDRVELARR